MVRRSLKQKMFLLGKYIRRMNDNIRHNINPSDYLVFAETTNHEFLVTWNSLAIQFFSKDKGTIASSYATKRKAFNAFFNLVKDLIRKPNLNFSEIEMTLAINGDI